MYASTLPRSNWLRRASILLAWYRHMPASSYVLNWRSSWINNEQESTQAECGPIGYLNVICRGTGRIKRVRITSSGLHVIASLEIVFTDRHGQLVVRRRRRFLHVVDSSREVAARIAVCRASRLPCSRCTCTDAGTGAVPPFRKHRWRRGRSDCTKPSVRSVVLYASPWSNDVAPFRTQTCNKRCSRHSATKTSMCVFVMAQ